MSRRVRNADEFGNWAYDVRCVLGLSTEAVASDLGYDRTVLVKAEGRQRSRQMEQRLPVYYAEKAAERGIVLPPAPGKAPEPVTATTDIDRLVDTVRAQSGYIADLTAAIDQQRQDIAALLEVVRKLLPGGGSVTPPDDAEVDDVDDLLHGDAHAAAALLARDYDAGVVGDHPIASAPQDAPRTPRPPAPRGSGR